ncbi:MAG TPA: transaldolase, partial [Bradyrhizobium sp.]|nr:transaldolase [Bradyrhizobium sp.]
MAQALNDLAAANVSVWLDDLSRPRIISGSLARMVDASEIVGITTNPTIFCKAIGAGSGYEDQVRDLALRGTAIGESLRLLTAWDVRAACDILRPVYDRTAARDGRVSIEVDPRPSGDADRTAAEARGLWWLVDRPSHFIKIPATLAGLPAITACLADGISVNVTLIFSLDRYRAVLGAFFAGLEQRLAAGHSLSGIESVASFFISRVDTEVDRRLDDVGAQTGADREKSARLRGQAAIANAGLAYEIYEHMLVSNRWKALAAAGAHPQRLLWASTGVKDKTFSDTRYVTELVAPVQARRWSSPTSPPSCSRTLCNSMCLTRRPRGRRDADVGDGDAEDVAGEVVEHRLLAAAPQAVTWAIQSLCHTTSATIRSSRSLGCSPPSPVESLAQGERHSAARRHPDAYRADAGADRARRTGDGKAERAAGPQ